MSILIKGMDMPPSCRYCEFLHMSLTQNAFCTAAHETIDYMAERTKRLANCPLVEVEEFEVWPNNDKSRKFTILKTKGGMHFMGPNGPVEAPKGGNND